MQQKSLHLSSSTKGSYDICYKTRNYFGYREWIYRPYLKALLARANVKAGSALLDVGCGQGFFSNLLRKCGMRVTGMDMSETGIRMARECYGSSDIEFLVADVKTISTAERFDCVFVRSLSLYNMLDFATSQAECLFSRIIPI